MIDKIKIALADDEVLIRNGLKAILEQEDNFEVVFESSNGVALLNYIHTTTSIPDIIIMDVKMPELNGIETTKTIAKQFPNIKIIALSSYSSPTFVLNMLEVGAVCYLSKSVSQAELITSVNAVVKNGFYFENAIMKHINEGTGKTKSFFDSTFFTDREIHILKLICLQYSANEIAEKLFISPRTVDGHRNNLLLKTESKNITGLVVFAIKNNFFYPDIEG